MMQRKIYGFGTAALLAVATLAGGADMRHHAETAQTAMTLVDPATVTLAPAPINPAWLLEGHPKTEASEIAHSDDGTTRVYVWQTSAARFDWFYDSDEIVTVSDCGVLIDDHGHGIRRLGPGDVAFFPAGARTTWRVPDHLRKIATLKRPAPSAVAAVQRWWHALKDVVKPAPAFAAG